MVLAEDIILHIYSYTLIILPARKAFDSIIRLKFCSINLLIFHSYIYFFHISDQDDLHKKILAGYLDVNHGYVLKISARKRMSINLSL
jgi:hypothetical protein